MSEHRHRLQIAPVSMWGYFHVDPNTGEWECLGEAITFEEACAKALQYDDETPIDVYCGDMKLPVILVKGEEENGSDQAE